MEQGCFRLRTAAGVDFNLSVDALDMAVRWRAMFENRADRAVRLAGVRVGQGRRMGANGGEGGKGGKGGERWVLARNTDTQTQTQT